MNYPAWEVPGIGGPWVIGAISIFHVLIAWFAVGGGMYLPMAEAHAMKNNRENWLPVLKAHSKFFLILTGVFGAISGVGIWFAIGLVHPEATSTLIHNFVFGWAIEWVFFIVELTAAAVYYLTWDRIPRELHIKVGYLYAIASVLTLVIINGILSFMLTPGGSWLSVAGTGAEASKFWMAFFNPTYFPSLFIRVLACLALAGVYALLTLARLSDSTPDSAKVTMTRWSSRWLTPMFLLLPVGMIWFLAMVPQQQRSLLELGMQTIGSGAFTQVTRASMLSVMTTAVIAGVVYFFAFKHPRDFSVGHAVAVLILAIIGTASTEYTRELIRKPWVIGDHMYSNGVRARDVEKFNTEGYLSQTMWAAKSDPGEMMFRGQCMSCHTVDGYRSMKKLLAGRDAKGVLSLLQMLRKAGHPGQPYAYMPPLVGTPGEETALAAYLTELSRPTPTTPEGSVASR